MVSPARAYEKLADAYARMIDTKPHNAYLERPATLSLLPNVEGKRVLDAECRARTTRELAESLQLRANIAQKMTYSLRHMDVIVTIGNRGRANLYSIKQKS